LVQPPISKGTPTGHERSCRKVRKVAGIYDWTGNGRAVSDVPRAVGEQLISVRLKTTGSARFDLLGLRRIMFNFEEVQHAVVNPAWDKKAGKF
jgi:IS5 family transposase